MRDYQIPERFWLNLLLGFLLIYAFLVVFWDPKGIIFDKMELVWLLPRVVLLLGIGLIGLLATRNLKDYLGIFPLLIIGQLILVLVSTLFANDAIQFKLLGPDRRMDGLLYYTGLSLFALFVYMVAKNKDISTHLLTIFSIVGIFEALIIILERLGIQPYSLLAFGPPAERINGSIGHFGMAAGLLLPALICSFFLFWKTNKGFKILAALGMILIAAALGITTTRAAYLALLFILPFILIIKRDAPTVVMLILLALIPVSAKNIIPNPNNLNVVTRSYTDTTSGSTRLLIWDLVFKAMQATKGMPFIGGGPDAFRLALIRDVSADDYVRVLRVENGWPDSKMVDAANKLIAEGPDPRSSLLITFSTDTVTQKQEQEFYPFDLDKAHNFILDRWLAFGLFNALIWIILYAFPIYFGLRSKQLSLQLLSIVFLAIGVYYLAWFPVIQVEPYHVTLLALAWALKEASTKKIGEGATTHLTTSS